MTDSGCVHPEAEVVSIVAEYTLIDWCSLCGSIRDNNGDHGAPAGTWRAPTGLVLPGWACGACKAWNGAVKERLTECRACGAPRVGR